MAGTPTPTRATRRGSLPTRLSGFAQALAALHQDLGDRMADVVVVTMSEFGRTVHQNGNRGTDHGHGTCFFTMGGPIKGGKVYGHWPTLAPDKLFQNRDLAVTTDFREVFGEISARHFRCRCQRCRSSFRSMPSMRSVSGISTRCSPL